MPVIYDEPLMQARLAATRERLNAGTLELGTDGFGHVVARFRLDTPCAEVRGRELVCLDMPKRTKAMNKGQAVEARFVDADGVVAITGLTVGGEEDDAEVTISPDADLKAGQTVELTDVRIIHG